MKTDFEFVNQIVVDLEPIMIVRYGKTTGAEVAGDLREYAWEHASRLAAMDNPAGYLYRVAQSKSRRYRRWDRGVDLPGERPSLNLTTEVDAQLHDELARLGADDRTIVVMVHSYGHSYDEVAAVTGLTAGAVRNRLHRAMTRLRAALIDQEKISGHR